MEKLEEYYCYNGTQTVWSHYSSTLNCNMKFAIYIPEQATQTRLPVLYWLSGLTCTEQNFITKSGFQRYASENNIIVVAPDTSPRGENVPDNDSYDLGQGAGFYVNASQKPWNVNYHMYDYILEELPKLVENNFPVTDKKSISGHSMGGHGALVLALRNPDIYTSVSAFAPIVSPSQVEWGKKAFSHYLGQDEKNWELYDSVKLILNGYKADNIFIDQGLADSFYKTQLHTYLLEDACNSKQVPITIRYHNNYDHSYYFISTFIEDHIRYHAEKLRE
ncbi:S-formylglutathione hydrolase [Otariodibacter sp.]|uniref:S-formylglutathione hydrolase n=1 Tax=Otariodibacter sp. TaxID=3030919 RepID=UPI002617A5FA|nr:S-formylglutathione hydrolase [Otariodibacter sp.]